MEASISSEWEGEREAETWVVVRGPGEMKECWMSWRARSLRESMSVGRWWVRLKCEQEQQERGEVWV